MSPPARPRPLLAVLHGASAAIVIVVLLVLGGAAASAVSPSTTAPTASTIASAGSAKKVLVLGDSVLAGIPAAGQLSALRAALPGWQLTFDAVECRSIEGPRKACGDKPGTVDGGLEALREHGTAFDAVVIQLGTNDAADPASALQTIAAAKTILAQLSAVPHVYWLTIREAGHYAAGYKTFNAALRTLPASVPNLTVVDWAAATAKKTALFGGDGLHLSNAGAREAVTVIAGAVNGDLPATVPTVVPTSVAPSTAAPSPSGASGASTPVPGTGAGNVSSANDSTTNIVIGIVVALVLIGGIVIAVLAGRRRERKHRREERTARVEAELARTAAHGDSEGDETDAVDSSEPTADEEPRPEAPATDPPA